MSPAVRCLGPADAAEYVALRQRALREIPPAFGSLPEDEPNAAETALRLEPGDDQCFFGTARGNGLVGIIRASRYSAANEKHRAYLAGLYVIPEYRRHGYGGALVREALRWAGNVAGVRRVNLTVVTRQAAAIRLYQSLGFRTYGTERETFSAGGQFFDEHLMTLSLRSR